MRIYKEGKRGEKREMYNDTLKESKKKSLFPDDYGEEISKFHGGRFKSEIKIYKFEKLEEVDGWDILRLGFIYKGHTRVVRFGAPKGLFKILVEKKHNIANFFMNTMNIIDMKKLERYHNETVMDFIMSRGDIYNTITKTYFKIDYVKNFPKSAVNGKVIFNDGHPKYSKFYMFWNNKWYELLPENDYKELAKIDRLELKENDDIMEIFKEIGIDNRVKSIRADGYDIIISEKSYENFQWWESFHKEHEEKGIKEENKNNV